MKGISHQQAVKWIHLRLDGLLKESQNLSLNIHLDSCDSCRAYAAEMDMLPARLQNEFQTRWDRSTGPSHKVLEHVAARARRIPMTNRISSSIRLTASAFLVAFLLLGINFVILQMKSNLIVTNGTQSVSGSELTNNRLLAFTSQQDGNFDIYTMHADGSGLTNITNHPAFDSSPFWSPDGKHILFESDRTGINQIYLMAADGSNVVQLTNEDAEHSLLLPEDARFSLWSPDGSRFLFLQKNATTKANILQSMDINSGNRIILASDTRGLGSATWSPSGEYVGYVLWDEVQPGGFVPNIYVVEATGKNTQELSKHLAQNEHIFTPYFWSSDGRSIIFPASVYEERREIVYQLDPQQNVLSALMTTKPMLYDWYDGVALGIDGEKGSQPLVWQRPDGTSTELDFQNGADPANCYISKARSLQGNLVVGYYCKQDNYISLYWTNVDGSKIQKLPEIKVPVLSGGLMGLTLSPDEKFVTFNFESEDETYLYIWNIEDALNDPAVQPIRMGIGRGKVRYFPSWQPILNDEVALKEPTPEPTLISSSDSLIAFTADNNIAANPNMDIYTVRLDGSNLTNLTHDPVKDFNANDYNPAWSPDRKKIAFMSDRGGSTTGNTNLFVMNPDGSNLTQLTYNPGYDAFLSWSPDGERIVYFSSPNAESNAKGQLIVMNADGANKTVLTTLGYYYFQSWSPDSQKIVYLEPRFDGTSYQDVRIHITDIDGTTGPEWFVDDIDQVHWEDSEHFLGVVQTGRETQARWSLYRFGMDSSQVELASQLGPVVSIFESTYVVESRAGLMWYGLEDPSTSLATWDPAENCEATGGLYHATSLNLLPDEKHALAIIYCEEATWYFLVNEDGSEVGQLGSPSNTSPVILPNWSPNGSYISLFLTNRNNPAYEDLYLMDIQKMVNDTSATPLLLATNVLAGVGTVEPLIARNETEAKPTPKPPAFSLSVYEAEKLAFFDVLEPSYLPAGYALEGAAYNAWTQQVTMKFVSQQENNFILVSQQRGDFLHYSDLRASTTPVSIGSIGGEFIQGASMYESPDPMAPAWNPRANSYTLRWQKGEFVFSINFIGSETITPLPFDDFVAIAENLK